MGSTGEKKFIYYIFSLPALCPELADEVNNPEEDPIQVIHVKHQTMTALSGTQAHVQQRIRTT